MPKTLPPEAIMYILGNGNYSTLFMADGNTTLMSYSLKVYQTKHPHFIRISKQALVNPEYVIYWTKQGHLKGSITVLKGKRMPIAGRRIHHVIKTLENRLAIGRASAHLI